MFQILTSFFIVGFVTGFTVGFIVASVGPL